MSKTSLLPDPMPLRDALRGLRFVLQRSSETLVSVLPVEALPKPAAQAAGAILRDMGQLASGLENMASDLARMAFGADESVMSLRDIGTGEADRFAQAFYAALRAVLARLHALPAHVSETAIRNAYQSLPPCATEEEPDRAAALSHALRHAKVLRGATLHATNPIPEAHLESLAIFAVLLCLQVERQDGEEDQVLAAATDLAVALAADVISAFDAKDSAPLAALYRKFAPHV